MTRTLRVKKEVDGHWHPVHGVLKAGAVHIVEVGEDGIFPDQIFEPVEAEEASHEETEGGDQS